MGKFNPDWVSISLKPDDWERGRYVQEWCMKREELYMVREFLNNLCGALDTYLACVARKEITVTLASPGKRKHKKRNRQKRLPKISEE